MAIKIHVVPSVTDPQAINYVTTNGSIMVYVPKFHYRIGSLEDFPELSLPSEIDEKIFDDKIQNGYSAEHALMVAAKTPSLGVKISDLIRQKKRQGFNCVISYNTGVFSVYKSNIHIGKLSEDEVMLCEEICSRTSLHDYSKKLGVTLFDFALHLHRVNGSKVAGLVLRYSEGDGRFDPYEYLSLMCEEFLNRNIELGKTNLFT